jgi:hypothetical protein
VDHLGGHEGGGGGAISADEAGGAKFRVGLVGGGLVRRQDGGGAHKGEVRAGHCQALQGGLGLLAKDECVAHLVSPGLLLDPAR